MAPSGLSLPRSPTQQQSREARRASLHQRQTIVTIGPWGGYVPDISPDLLSAGDGQQVSGLIDDNGWLTFDDGFSRVDPTRLPLAYLAISAISIDAAAPTITFTTRHGLASGVSVVFSGTDSTPPIDGTRIVTSTGDFTVTIAFTTTVAGTTGRANIAEPIIGMYAYRDRVQTVREFAWTARTSTGRGHMNEIGSSGQWIPRGPAVAADALTSDSGELIDAAYYPDENILIFTNDKDVVYRFPTGGNEYEVLPSGTFAPFRARSVAAFAQRMNFFNVEIAGISEPQTLVATQPGGQTIDGTAVGNVRMVLDELGGQGLKILPLGDLLACYGEEGVAFVRRKTNANDPYERSYLTQPRGLLSTHSVVPVGSGVHFGLFTDGWFFLDSTGRWTEAGVVAHSGVGQARVHKWLHTFYSLLNWNQRRRVNVEYDRVRRFVRISFPQAGSNVCDQYWIYDLENDRVWPDENYGPTCPSFQKEFLDVTAAAATWDAAAGGFDPTTTPWDGTGLTWDALAASTERWRINHGTEAGLVFRRTLAQPTRDGGLPSYRFLSHKSDFGLPSPWKVLDRIQLTYRRLQSLAGADPTAIDVRARSNKAVAAGFSDGGSVPQVDGSVGTDQTNHRTMRVSGTRLGYELSGTHPVMLSSVQLGIDIQGTETIKEER